MIRSTLSCFRRAVVAEGAGDETEQAAANSQPLGHLMVGEGPCAATRRV